MNPENKFTQKPFPLPDPQEVAERNRQIASEQDSAFARLDALVPKGGPLGHLRWRSVLLAMGVSAGTVKYLALARRQDDRICSCNACRRDGKKQFYQHLHDYCQDNGYTAWPLLKWL